MKKKTKKINRNKLNLANNLIKNYFKKKYNYIKKTKKKLH